MYCVGIYVYLSALILRNGVFRFFSEVGFWILKHTSKMFTYWNVGTHWSSTFVFYSQLFFYESTKYLPFKYACKILYVYNDWLCMCITLYASIKCLLRKYLYSRDWSVCVYSVVALYVNCNKMTYILCIRITKHNVSRSCEHTKKRQTSRWRQKQTANIRYCREYEHASTCYYF